MSRLNVKKERAKIRKARKKPQNLDDLRKIFGSSTMHSLIDLKRIKKALSEERIYDAFLHSQLKAAIARAEMDNELIDLVHKNIPSSIYDKYCNKYNKGYELNFKDFIHYSSGMLKEAGKKDTEDYKKINEIRLKRREFNEIIHKKN